MYSTESMNNLTPSQKKKMKKYHNMHYLTQLKNFHEMQELKAKNIAYRNHILERQKISNYKNELDKVKGLIAQTTTRGETMAHLMKKKKEIEKIKNDIASLNKVKYELEEKIKNTN